MKKFLILFVSIFMMLFMSCDFTDTTMTTGNANRWKTAAEQTSNLQNAMTAYPTPVSKYFLERKTIKRWTETWDQPSVMCYTYVFMSGFSQPIGYFITDGKPASTQSFLIPEDYDIYDTSSSGTHMTRQAADLDGTYGANNPGYRFFLANGTAVEVSGYIVGLIYANAKLNLNCPEIAAYTKK